VGLSPKFVHFLLAFRPNPPLFRDNLGIILPTSKGKFPGTLQGAPFDPDAVAMAESEKYTEAQRHEIFNKEFVPYLDSAYNFAYKLTLDEDNAKDLVQDSFTKAFRFINSFERGTNAKAWLFKILKNSFINEFRRQQKQPATVDYQDVEQVYNSDDVDEDYTVDMRSESVQDMIGDEVTNAINALPVDFRTVIILCDLEDFTYEEMAKILDIPIGTVRSRLHRARSILKNDLQSYAKKMGYAK
jgi:RNA polymerase sigma factor (sigma-70 family)